MGNWNTPLYLMKYLSVNLCQDSPLASHLQEGDPPLIQMWSCCKVTGAMIRCLGGEILAGCRMEIPGDQGEFIESFEKMSRYLQTLKVREG